MAIMYKLLAVAVLTATLWACNSSSPGDDKGQERPTRVYFFWEIDELRGVRALASGRTTPLKHKMDIVADGRTYIELWAEYVSTHKIRFPNGRTRFEQVADSLGDGDFRGGDMPRQIFISGIKGVELTALTDYNEHTHAGSSLAPIARLLYYSFAVRPPGGGYECWGYPEPHDQPLSAEMDIHLPTRYKHYIEMEQDMLGVIVLDEPASQPEQRMRLRVSLLDGRVLEHEFDIVIREFEH